MQRWLAVVTLGFVAASCATGEEAVQTPLAQEIGADADGDGYAAEVDCDDGDPNVRPGAVEICNGKDDDCNGRIDEAFDVDGDGYATCGTPVRAADCDDRDPSRNPGAPEVCNNRDDNCDGRTDEGFDADNDGYYACARGQTPADCDDDSKTIYPGALEVCNERDDNCDGRVDELPATLSGSLGNPVDAHWLALGSASTPGDGWGRLTPDSVYLGGALWWKAGDLPGSVPASYLFDEFELTATFWINRADGADGMTFAWIKGTNYAVGYYGDGYGVRNLDGYAVVIDTLTHPGEAVAPFLVVYDDSKKNTASAGHLFEVAVPEVRNAANHTLFVKLSAGAVTVAVDGTTRINAFALPGYVPFKGHWGFTASTGGLSEAHAVRDVTMRFPRGQGCVP